MKRVLTRAEVEALIAPLERSIERIEEEHPGIAPLPAMTTEECLEYLRRLMDHAAERPLTGSECFLHGQVLAVYMHAVRAETLGKKGRFFVIREDEIAGLLDAGATP